MQAGKVDLLRSVDPAVLPSQPSSSTGSIAVPTVHLSAPHPRMNQHLRSGTRLIDSTFRSRPFVQSVPGSKPLPPSLFPPRSFFSRSPFTQHHHIPSLSLHRMLLSPSQYVQPPVSPKWAWVPLSSGGKKLVFPPFPPGHSSNRHPAPAIYTWSLLDPSPSVTEEEPSEPSFIEDLLKTRALKATAGPAPPPPPPGFSTVPFLIPGLAMDIKDLIVLPRAIQIIDTLLEQQGDETQPRPPFLPSTTLFLQLLRLQLSLSPTTFSSNESSFLEDREGVLPRAATHRVVNLLVSIHTLFVLRTGSERLYGEMTYLEELVEGLVKELGGLGESGELWFVDEWEWEEVNNNELESDDVQSDHLRPHPSTLLPNPWFPTITATTPPLTPSTASSSSSFTDDGSESNGLLPSTPSDGSFASLRSSPSPSYPPTTTPPLPPSIRSILTESILLLDTHLRQFLSPIDPLPVQAILPTRILISTSFLLYLLSTSHTHLSTALTVIAQLWEVASQRGGEPLAFGPTGSCGRASEESWRRMEYVLRVRDRALEVAGGGEEGRGRG
ncbi:hypothetical protein BDY24DRAFT_441836 [Mrakia frigida]|uniref:uncharacterized protein n=1 Tax=Mrakia frigida TaxID=29902 RepID=UPI003FCC0B47